ncbi:class I SAM-dependent methyltransferase [Ectobacillus sp. sgz5001026]|uniref:class I SAM-dependent methyltransferase n=1 Tax=Ectobacillus sp. sgz5001026 TaxID=3242473 RepID=UPI0036D28FF2
MTGHRFNPEHANKLLNPKRGKAILPENVIEIMNIQKGDQVVELGAGNGYFTLPIARITEEMVYAVDIEPHMLSLLQDRAREQHISNLTYVTSDVTNTQLPDEVADKVLFAFVAHEIPDIGALLREVSRIVKKGGQLLIVEWEAVVSESGPALEERIPSIKLQNLLTSFGYASKFYKISDSVYGLLVRMS